LGSQKPSLRFISAISMPTSGLRVTPMPPLAVHGLAAAPETAIAVGSVSSLSTNSQVGCQPVALLPQ
jgi:hypothetical protein